MSAPWNAAAAVLVAIIAHAGQGGAAGRDRTAFGVGCSQTGKLPSVPGMYNRQFVFYAFCGAWAMPDYNPYDRVEVVTDRFVSEGMSRGAIGYVIERWADGALEVEILNPDGSTAS